MSACSIDNLQAAGELAWLQGMQTKASIMPCLDLWYRATGATIDSLKSKADRTGDAAIIAVLQHEVLLTRACIYLTHREQDDSQHQMHILCRTFDEVRIRNLLTGAFDPQLMRTKGALCISGISQMLSALLVA